MKKFLFSVIVPIYNVEEYLEETIESVINQTIDFKKNIQMILVNDGSPDNSESICLKYRDLYPENIIYIKQKNGGVSSARNHGLEYAEGEYVNFLDSDDKWELDAFKKIANFFKKNSDIAVVVGRMRFFDSSKKFHMLDYKFDEGTRVIHIEQEPSMIHLHITSSVIKTDIAKKYEFDEKLKYGEDAKYLAEIVIDQKKYGIVKEARFYYRRRSDNTSAVQNKEKNIDWYTLTVERYYHFLFELSQKKYKDILDYVKYLVMYDYQFRLRKLFPENLSENTKKVYIQKSKKLLEQIDDAIILDQKNMHSEYKLYAFKIKYGNQYKEKIRIEDNFMFFNGDYLYTINNRNVLVINILKGKGEKLVVYGQINSILPKDDYKIFVKVDNEEIPLNLKDSRKNIRYGVDEELYHNMTFHLEIPLKYKEQIAFYLQYKDEEPYLLKPNFKIMTKLDNYYRNYWNYKKYTLKARKNIIFVARRNKIKNIFATFILYLQMLTHFKIKQTIYRFIYSILNLFKRTEIWLISDRTTVANDNGMHLFKYINAKPKRAEKTYFVLDKHSKNFSKMKQYGKVVAHNSFKYKMLFLLSDKIISSQADIWVYNAFGKNARFYRDLYNFKFVFLQHGITKDDISNWLNIYNKDIEMFVTAAPEEYKSILSGEYEYDESIVKLTGFPRYDNLVDNSEKKIAIMPTWRQDLSGKINRSNGTREYNPDFKKSEYFLFYNNLINDKKLIKTMKDCRYKGVFVMHPSHMENVIDFVENDTFEIVRGFADYQSIFKECKLLVSDYSSVPFDFAYMHKPVIYSQFDKETFFGKHLYSEGYFKYERDGFGPVTHAYEETLDTIIKYIENDCVIEKKYDQRILKFYKYHDKKNCERVYNEIKKL